MNLRTRIPLVPLGEGHIALLMGTPNVALEAVVNIRDLTSMQTYRDLIVLDTVVCSIIDTPEDILTAFGFSNFSDLRVATSEAFRVSLPAEAQVTFLVLGDTTPDFVVEEDEDEVEMSDDDILPLVLPMPDEDDWEFEGTDDSDGDSIGSDED